MERSSYYRKALGRKVVCRILPGLLCFLPVLLPASGRSLVPEKGLVSGRVSASGQDVSFSLQDLGRGRYSYKGIRLRDGDLIFQEACQGATEDAIKGVTRSAGGYAFTHVGMVCIREGKAYVLEANVPRVSLTPLEAFLMPENVSSESGTDGMGAGEAGTADTLAGEAAEADVASAAGTDLLELDSAACPPISVLARLKPAYRKLIPKALALGMACIGKSYDYGYVLGDSSYYCSELIYQILKDANQGQEVFPLNRMTFKDSTGRTLPGWEAYFERHSMPVPEGEAGINPGAMSRSKVIRLLRRLD